ncbi:unnamed protein product [Dicrocoelium dendriticum]|nr:unnamed protein product [Dicrocoelium dendriticum]
MDFFTLGSGSHRVHLWATVCRTTHACSTATSRFLLGSSDFPFQHFVDNTVTTVEHLTRNRGFLGSRWWWEDEDFSRPFTHLEPETAALVQWLRDYEPTAVFAFPTSSAPSIGYGVDPSETDYAQNITAESHNWLQFLAYLLAPGFHHFPPHCFEPALDKPSPPDHRRRGLIDPVAHSADRSDSFVSLASRSLSLASMSPQLALSEMQTEQLQHSTSFPPPLPLPAPINMGLSLCPACRSPTPIGVARVWKDFRLPSLLLGLIGHATLTAPGSFGLIGEVQSTSGEPIPWARVHFDNMRSELSTRSRINRGQFSIALPPGTFRISIRASGYLDLVELVTIDPRGGTVHRIFRMIPVSALSATTRTYLLVTAGSFVACLLSATTIWLSYRFCFRPRTPYALARRTLASKANSSSKFNDPGHDGRRGAYRLIPLGSDAYSIGDNEHESEQDALHQSMLNHALEDGDQDDLDEVPSMDIQPKTGLLLTRSKRAHSHQKPTNLSEDSGGLEEVPLV